MAEIDRIVLLPSSPCSFTLDLHVYIHGVHIIEETLTFTRFIDGPMLKQCLQAFGATVQSMPNQATTTIILGDLERDTRTATWERSRAEGAYINESERRRAQGQEMEIDLYSSLMDFIETYPDSGLRQAVTSHTYIADFSHDESKKKPARDVGPSRSIRYLMSSILKDKSGQPILGLKSIF